jgi:hypothetical protein
MARKKDSETIQDLREKAAKLQKKANDLEKKTFIQIGKVVTKYIDENIIKPESIEALNLELRATLRKI